MMHIVDAHRRFVSRACRALLLLLVGLSLLLPGAVAAGQPGPGPTIGNIVVNSFDCDDSTISFEFPVANLPRSGAEPEGIDSTTYPVQIFITLIATDGTSHGPTRRAVQVASDPGQGPTYSNIIGFLHAPSRVDNPGIVRLVNIEILVGPVGFYDTNTPSDSTELSYVTGCANDGQPDIIQQLIAVLIAILEEILGGS